MSIDSKAVDAAAEVERYFETGTYGHAAGVALVLERLPNGEHAWLRPSTDAAEADDALWTISERGRDYLRRVEAEDWLFGPRPTVAEAG